MNRRNGEEPSPNSRPRGSDPRRLTQAQLLERQQTILVDRDVHNMTWAAIGRKHSMGEKEARETYGRYLREIVPLIVEQAPEEKVLEYLRLLEGARQRLAEVVEAANNDSARIGGLREIVKTVSKEIELLEHAGLMPHGLGQAHARAEHERILQKVDEVLRRRGVSPEVYEELAATLDPGGER
jgi:hypothetical protein